MKIYTSTKKIPGLKHMSLPERMAILETASRKMTVPEKTLLNIIKLLVIVPVFALLLRVVESWWSLAWAGLILLLYPMFVKPLQYSMSVKYLGSLLQGNDEGGSPLQGNDVQDQGNDGGDEAHGDDDKKDKGEGK